MVFNVKLSTRIKGHQRQPCNISLGFCYKNVDKDTWQYVKCNTGSVFRMAWVWLQLHSLQAWWTIFPILCPWIWKKGPLIQCCCRDSIGLVPLFDSCPWQALKWYRFASVVVIQSQENDGVASGCCILLWSDIKRQTNLDVPPISLATGKLNQANPYSVHWSIYTTGILLLWLFFFKYSFCKQKISIANFHLNVLWQIELPMPDV